MNRLKVPLRVTPAIRFLAQALSCLLVIGCLVVTARAEMFPVSTRSTADQFAPLPAANSHSRLLRDWETERILAEGRTRRTFAALQRDRSVGPLSARANAEAAGNSLWPMVALIGLFGVAVALTAGGIFLFGPLAGARSARVKKPPFSLLR